jgi:hypothetical protein
MSYEKAMKHARHPNLKKGRNQYMGFDTGILHSKTPEILHKWIEIGRWFKDRHDEDSQYNRECIREAILDYRNEILAKKLDDATN